MGVRRLRPSPAMVVALLALVVSLSGVGYAASLVGTSDIQNGAVTTPKLHNGAVTKAKLHGNAVNGSKVIDNSITGNDVNESTLDTVPNAQQLQGFEPSDFQRAGAVLFGTGTITSNSNLPIFSAPVLKMGLETDGDPDDNSQLAIINNNSSGSLIGTPFTKFGTGSAFAVPANGVMEVGPASGAANDFLDMLVTNAGHPGESVWVHCLLKPTAGVKTAFCWGIQAV